MNLINQIKVMDALQASWSADTAYNAADWSRNNPARGQCLVSSLVVQDYLDGDLKSFTVAGSGIDETHHCNLLPDGTLFDSTSSQYDGKTVTQVPKEVDTKGYVTLRERYLADPYDRSRYELLKTRVEQYLSDSTKSI